jgi:hypothetical protein
LRDVRELRADHGSSKRSDDGAPVADENGRARRACAGDVDGRAAVPPYTAFIVDVL